MTRIVDAGGGGALVGQPRLGHPTGVRGPPPGAGRAAHPDVPGVGRFAVVVAAPRSSLLPPAVHLGRPPRCDRPDHAGVLRAAMGVWPTSDPPRAVGRHAHAFVTGGVSSDSGATSRSAASARSRPASSTAPTSRSSTCRAQAVTEQVRLRSTRCRSASTRIPRARGWWSSTRADSSRRLVAAPVDRPLRVLRGDLDDLLADPALTGGGRILPGHPHRPGTPAGPMDRLRHFRTPSCSGRTAGGAVSSSYAAALGRRSDDLDVCCDFLAHVRGGYPRRPRAGVVRRGRRGVAESRAAARLDELRQCCRLTTSFRPRTGVAWAAPARRRRSGSRARSRSTSTRSGPTGFPHARADGAGKTNLLDAVCFALYAGRPARGQVAVRCG